MDKIVNLQSEIKKINDAKRQSRLKQNEQYIKSAEKYILDDHNKALLLARSILDNEDAIVSYNISGPNIILSIEEQDNKITFNINKVTKSYKINASTSSLEDEVENNIEYSYVRYLDGYYVTNVSKDYNNGEELVTTVKKSYQIDNEGNAELIDIYKYEKTDLYSWILQESMRDDNCIVTLLVLKEDYNIDTSIRGIKQKDCVNFYDGVCSGLVLSEDMYISVDKVRSLIDRRVKELVEGVDTDMPMVFNPYKTVYLDYYNSEQRNDGDEKALRLYATKFFDFNKDEVETIVQNAHVFKSYINSFGETMATINMKDGSTYTVTDKLVPLFYMNPENQRVFYKNDNLQNTVLMSNYCNPNEINMYDVKSYTYDIPIDKDRKISQIQQLDVLENDQLYVCKESSRNVSYNNPLSLKRTLSYDCNGVIETDMYSTRFQNYYDDRSQKVFTYDFMPVPLNLGGYKIVLKEGVNDKGESNIEVATAFGSRYLDEVEDEFKFNDIWDMNVRKIVDGREIYLDTSQNDNINMDTSINKERTEIDELVFPNAQDAENVVLFCPLLNTEDTACFYYSTANDPEFSNVFDAINNFYKIAIGDDVVNATTITYDKEAGKIKIEQYNDEDNIYDM